MRFQSDLHVCLIMFSSIFGLFDHVSAQEAPRPQVQEDSDGMMPPIPALLYHDHHHDHHHNHYFHPGDDHGRQLNIPFVDDCGTPPLPDTELLRLNSAHKKWKKKHGNRRNLAAETITIPTYFHILRGPTVGHLDRSVITDLFVPKLNHGFRNSPFRFQLMEVIETVDMELYMCNRTWYPEKKLRLRRGGDDALNIYVCNTVADAANGWAGYPTLTMNFLPYDGVHVMNPQVARDNVTYFQTLIHETGHWLGLMHTFEPYKASSCEAVPEISGCDGRIIVDPSGNFKSFVVAGDGVRDTPAAERYGFCYNDWWNCFRTLESPLNTCPDKRNNIDRGLDPINNYMNYISGACREMYGEFTPGQVERMVAEYETFRDPNRHFNCGCASCTTDVLQNQVFINWVNPVDLVTCNDGLQELMKTYRFSKYAACDYIGKYFWKECGTCHPSTCQYIPKPPDCAKSIIQNRCTCIGTQPQEDCVRRNIQRECNFGSQVPSAMYSNKVWIRTQKLCMQQARAKTMMTATQNTMQANMQARMQAMMQANTQATMQSRMQARMQAMMMMMKKRK